MEQEDARDFSNKIYWWGYLHKNGSIQVKPYHPKWGDGDIDDALESLFILVVVGPFEVPLDTVDKREYAMNCAIKEIVNGK